MGRPMLDRTKVYSYAESKVCTKCNRDLPIENFRVRTRKERKDYKAHESRCRECLSAIGCEKQKNSYEQRNNRNMLRDYGISWDEYAVLRDKQGELCSICGGVAIRRLAIDHDHSTGEVRGLLCENCNVGIGYFKDDISLLIAAQKYLQNFYAATS